MQINEILLYNNWNKIQSKEKVAHYLAKNSYLPTHHAALATIMSVHAKTIPTGYIHPCINETHSLARFSPYFGRYNYKQHKLAKVGLYMHGYNYVPS